MAETPSPITVEYKGRVAIITIDNAKKLNALDQPGYYHLSQAMREVATHDEVFITLLIGKGRFFSAGADVSIARNNPEGSDADVRLHWLRNFAASNLNITQAFYSHPKILVVGLNGPTVGLSAALTGWADFVYAAPHTFLLTPFSSLGLVTEGGASRGLVQRLGISKANEALMMSKRIGIDELVATGYVNRVLDAAPGDDAKFRELVLKEIDDRLGDHLSGASLIGIKELIRKPDVEFMDGQGAREAFAGLQRFVSGEPQAEFGKIASGQKRHKL